MKEAYFFKAFKKQKQVLEIIIISFHRRTHDVLKIKKYAILKVGWETHYEVLI